MKTPLPKFARLQHQFTRYIREPDRNPVPEGVSPQRMKLYRELLYNNIEQFIANHFPVLRKITPDERWHAMIQDYFARHRAHTPLFPRIAEEFLHYLETEREDSNDPPFLRELAHYEWVEAALAIDTQEIEFRGIDPQGDLLRGVPVLSPLAWPFAYRFPVHRIAPEFQPQVPGSQPTYLIVYRDREDKVGFMELNPATARLLEWIIKDPHRTGRELLEIIAQELQHPDPEVVIQEGLAILQHWRARDVVLGVRKS